MNRPVTLWPPNGGTPVHALPQKVAEMEARGWTRFDPVAVAKGRAALTTPTVAKGRASPITPDALEDNTDGDS